MSEATLEALESEAYESSGEAYEGESPGEAYESEGESEGEAYEAFGEDARSDRARRARQQQMLRARRQSQVQPRRPPPPAPRRAVSAPPSPTQTVRAIRSDVRSLDVDTKAALARLRRQLDKANRMAYRNAWAAEASAAASQVLDSFNTGLAPHDWARALIRGAPTLALAPGEKRRPGLEGFLLDPRVGGSALLAGIWAIGHFRGTGQGVSTVQVFYSGPLTAAAGANHTATLTAVAQAKNGTPIPDVTFSYYPQTPANFSVKDQGNGEYELTGNKVGDGYFIVTANGKSGNASVSVT
jgi:hypothetical protein